MFTTLKLVADRPTYLPTDGRTNRPTDNVTYRAAITAKNSKNDEYFTIASDCLINGPPELVTHLTNLIRLYLVHGLVPNIVILCTLMPLVKNNLADKTSSENYRAIAGGSLLLKLLDIVILMLEGDKLGFDPMQFAYQPKASTTMCSWTATAVIEHFTRNGTAVFGAAMYNRGVQNAKISGMNKLRS